jgi:long-chain acyl-CoA synthetase
MKSKTLSQLFTKRCQLSGKNQAVGWIENNEVKFLNYQAYFSIVQSLSMALVNLGLARTDKIAILANTCKEWHFIDLASMNIGAVVIPIYHTYLVQDVEYLLKHSESKIVAIDRDDQLEKLIQIAPAIKTQIKTIILLGPCDDKTKQEAARNFNLLELEDLIHAGSKIVRENPIEIQDIYQAVKKDDLASIIYTSGTTGKPKGAMITHEAFCQMLENVKQFTQNAFGSNDRTLTFLPLSHVFGRCDSLMPLIFGWEMVFAASYESLLSDLEITKPTIMLAVPRVFEKIYHKLQESLEQEGLIATTLFNWAINKSLKYHTHVNHNLIPAYFESLQFKLAQKMILKKINQKFGGRIRYFVSGGSALSDEIMQIMNSVGFTILEGYGLTETIAPCFLNPIYQQEVGYVGKALGDVQIKLAVDGEILIKSKAMFAGYYKDNEATNTAFQDGWFLTGDIGEMNQNGFLKITDRKKDLIITSNGKNIAPQKIENLAKTCKHISHLIVIGDKRNYITALIGIEKMKFMQYLADFAIPTDCTIEALSHHPQIYNLIKEEVDKINQNLANFESIRKFTILPIEITTDNYLTPSQKIKRRVILQDFSHLVNTMYQESK